MSCAPVQNIRNRLKQPVSNTVYKLVITSIKQVANIRYSIICFLRFFLPLLCCISCTDFFFCLVPHMCV